MLCIFVSIFILSAGATRYDFGPQKFYESTSPMLRRDQNAGPKEVVLYLTPNQIKALKAGGAVVRPSEPENDSEEASEVAQQNEDQVDDIAEADQEQEQDNFENEGEQPERQGEPEQSEESEEDLEDRDLDLERIFRILAEAQLEQEEDDDLQDREEPQVTEKASEEDNLEDERQIPQRFQLRQNQQQSQQLQEKYLESLEQRVRSKTDAAIRCQHKKQLQKAIVQKEQAQTEAPLEKGFKLVPYEVEEQPEELVLEQQTQQAQEDQQNQQEEEIQQQAEDQSNEQQDNEKKLTELFTPLLSPEKLAEVIGQRKNKLFQNEQELQSVLRELKQSNKLYDQKYAIKIERLRANLLKQNALAKPEGIANAAPLLIRKGIQKQKPILSAKLNRAPALTVRKPELQRQRTPKLKLVPVEISKPTPVVKTQKVEVLRPIPVEVKKRVPAPLTRNVYTKVNKPYLKDRKVPVKIQKEIPVEIPLRKSQRETSLRHIWEH